MALSFPLAASDFFDQLWVQSISFDLPESGVNSGITGSGDILTADVGVRLWTGDVVIPALPYEDGEDVNAILDTLKQAGRAFFVYNMAKPGPRLDPNGVLLGSSTPKISSVASNNREITIYGLPAGYILSRGDQIAFTYGSSPIRYALHRLAVGGTANSYGITTVEVSNFVRSGAAADTPIDLIRPSCKAVIVPGSVSGGVMSGQFNTGIKFSWRQTLR